jgi:Tol biopolymer transport system component/DNA-binding winged helix-turn-helix (wHTH) protein
MSLNGLKNSTNSGSLRFADFVADPHTEELWRDGRRVRLPRQSFQVLVALTRVPGELVTREALQAQLWPAYSQVEYEQGLNAAINRLREALGDSAATPLYIETLPRRGYRFIGQLESAPTPAPARVPVPPDLATTVPELTSEAAPAPAAARPGNARAAYIAGGLAIIALFAFWLAREPASPPNSARLLPFTALTGEERWPSFSPDGTRMVFAWNGEPANKGGFDLYVKAMDSERLLRLTSAPSIGLSAAWSPDGASIAFARKLDGREGIFLVPAMGGAERRIAPAVLSDPPFLQLAWSPDGKVIAYSTFDSGAHIIRLVDIATLASQPLAHPPACWHTGLPAFSADGKQLAFICTTSVGVYGVYVVNDGGKPLRLATVMGEPQGLAWDSDQTSLIVANDAGDGGGLWKLTPDGAMKRQPFGEEGSAPTRTRDGNRVAYVRGRQAVDIWRMDLSAVIPGASAQRLIFSTRSEMTPQYSPDGSRIVFQSTRSGSAEIWMADADGANPVRLTQFNGPLSGAPQWCEDGKRVAFDSRAAGTSAVYIMDVEERQPRRVGGARTELGLPAWSSDCAWIIASDGRVNLYKLPVAGGAAELFTRQPSYYAQVAGDRVIFNVKRPDGVTLWTKSIAGGEEVALPGMPRLGYTDAWAAAPAGVYFTSAPDGTPALHFYDFANQTTRRITALPKTPAPGGGLGIAVSRDGRWLLYTQSGEAQSDIMLMVKE